MKNINFEKWLETFVEEKGLDMDYMFTIEHKGFAHMIDLGYVISLCKVASEREQGVIKNTIVKIDFCNGDVLDFFKHLAKCYIEFNY